MSSHEFFTDPADDVVGTKIPATPRKLTQKNYLEAQITEFVAKLLGATAIDGIDDLASFLEHVLAQGLVALLSVPRTTVGREQPLHELDEARERATALLLEGRGGRHTKWARHLDGSISTLTTSGDFARLGGAVFLAPRARKANRGERMNDSPPLLVGRDANVATVTLNRPETRNALNAALLSELAKTFESLAGDPDVRAIILTGNGKGFCSGADLRAAMEEGSGLTNEERIEQFHLVLRSVVNCPTPVIGALNGGAVGFGADLALACDLRVLSSDAYIQEIFVNIGLMPDGGGTFWLPRLVGIGRALEYLLLGTRLDADLAKELGLANRVAPPDELSAVANELATAIAQGPPLAFAQIKSAVRESWTGTVFSALDREKAGQSKLLDSNDMREGVMAWAQKRPPEFKGT